MARVPLVDRDDLPPERRALLDTMADAEGGSEGRVHSLQGGTLNVFRALAHDVDLLEEFRSYATLLRREGDLTAEEREFVILATAHATRSAYEWHQHVRVALDEGMAPEQIRAVASDDLDALAPEHAALVTYVRRFVESAVDDDVHRQVTEHYDERAVVAVGLLAGLYLGLARSIDAFDLHVEGEFVGWGLENL